MKSYTIFGTKEIIGLEKDFDKKLKALETNIHSKDKKEIVRVTP